MTMLDRMRRHRNWLKWSLALVCLTFVIFYIPDFLISSGAGAAPDEVVAEVEGSRLGLGASDAEVRERILSIPAFQENGAFIGEERYRQLLRMQRPPATVA